MNVEQATFGFPTGAAAEPEPLAHLKPFSLGPIRVEPARRRIVGPRGTEAVVEPLVIKVLIALARADGAPCSRDDLIAECWDRRFVGDDAVNRVISNLRRQLASVAGQAVSIETIAKVGYRLKTGPECPSDPTEDRTSPGAGRTLGRSSRSLLAIGALAIVAVSLGSGLAVKAPEGSLLMAIESEEGGGMPGFAGDLSADLSQLVGPMARLTLVEAGAPAQADLSLKVSHKVGQRGTGPSAHVRLVDLKDGAVVWAREFEGPTDDILRERAAYSISGIVRCGLHRSSGNLGDAVSKRLYFAACDAAENFDWPRAQSLARQIVERRPDAAASWACLALATANMAYAESQRRTELARQATDQARKALDLDPNSGLAYQALAVANNLVGGPALPLLEEGVRRDPEHPFLLALYSRGLADLGYVKDAVDPALHSRALEPNSYFAAQSVLLSLIGAGRLDEARQVDGHIRRIWNDSFNTGYTRNAMRFYDPDARNALREFERDPPKDGMLAERQRMELSWRVSPGAFDWSSFDRLAERTFAAKPDEAWYLAFSAVRMGDLERAFAWLARAPAPKSQRGVAPLFWPDATPMRRDRRFFNKMREIGLVDRWQDRRVWPDFCADSQLTYSCREEARRAAPMR